MADRYYRNGQAVHIDSTDGGEATPRPLKSRRLLDVMGDASTERGGKSSAVRESNSALTTSACPAQAVLFM